MEPIGDRTDEILERLALSGLYHDLGRHAGIEFNFVQLGQGVGIDLNIN